MVSDDANRKPQCTSLTIKCGVGLLRGSRLEAMPPCRDTFDGSSFAFTFSLCPAIGSIGQKLRRVPRNRTPWLPIRVIHERQVQPIRSDGLLRVPQVRQPDCAESPQADGMRRGRVLHSRHAPHPAQARAEIRLSLRSHDSHVCLRWAGSVFWTTLFSRARFGMLSLCASLEISNRALCFDSARSF